MSEAGALAYWFDIDPNVVDEWLDWYMHDHMPSRVGTTFVSGRCYEALHAASSHMVFFETTTPEALLAPSYLALLKQVSAEDRQRRAWYSNTIRATCRVRMQIGRGTGSVLGVVRIAGASAAPDDIARCLARDVIPTLARTPCIGSICLMENDPSIRARMDQARVTGHQDGSMDWAILIEAANESDVAAATAQLNGIASWRTLELGRHAVFDQFRLLYTMTGTAGATPLATAGRQSESGTDPKPVLEPG